jgi:hypothetical protein
MGSNDTAVKAAEDARAEARGRVPSGFADHVRIELAALVAYEMEITVQVGVMLAAGVSQSQILHSLGIDGSEFKMCKRRLQQVASNWINE